MIIIAVVGGGNTGSPANLATLAGSGGLRFVSFNLPASLSGFGRANGTRMSGAAAFSAAGASDMVVVRIDSASKIRVSFEAHQISVFGNDFITDNFALLPGMG